MTTNNTDAINQRIDLEGSVNETVCPGCNHDAAIRPLAEDGTCRWKVGEDEIGPKYCGHACRQACVNHCAHPITLVVDGVCKAMLPRSSKGPWFCNHRCTFSEPAKRPCRECGELNWHRAGCRFHFGVSNGLYPVLDSERVPELPERHEKHRYIPTQLYENSPCAWDDHPGGIGDPRYYCGLPPSAPIHVQKDEPQCAGLEGRHELEGALSEMFIHDSKCPKSAVQKAEAVAEPHEFESFDNKCSVPTGLGLLPCGQPKNAPVHVTILTVEEKLAAMRYDSEYQFRARRVLKESELSVGISLAADSVPNDLAIRIAVALAERDKLATKDFGRMAQATADREELDQLRREMESSSLGDRPHNIGAKKLARLIELESAESLGRVREPK